jgi:hypothetical protein
LAFALTFDGECRGREAADVYRSLFPDVDAHAITCAPSRSQYRWRSRWSGIWRRWWRNEDEAETAYESERECGCLPLGDDNTPAIEVLEQAAVALGPGEPQQNLSDAIAVAQERERVRRKR